MPNGPQREPEQLQLFSDFGRPQISQPSVETPAEPTRGPEQTLKMFMRPHEVKGLVGNRSVDANFGREASREQMHAMWDYKSRETSLEGTGMVRSIAREGVREPIRIAISRSGEFWHGNGHHRTQAAEEAEPVGRGPQYLPVTYGRSYMNIGANEAEALHIPADPYADVNQWQYEGLETVEDLRGDMPTPPPSPRRGDRTWW